MQFSARLQRERSIAFRCWAGNVGVVMDGRIVDGGGVEDVLG
jgi:hypothetical protein